MTDRAWNLLCRVIRRRMESGEALETALADYPKLTEEQRAELMEALEV